MFWIVVSDIDVAMQCNATRHSEWCKRTLFVAMAMAIGSHPNNRNYQLIFIVESFSYFWRRQTESFSMTAQFSPEREKCDIDETVAISNDRSMAFNPKHSINVTRWHFRKYLSLLSTRVQQLCNDVAVGCRPKPFPSIQWGNEVQLPNDKSIDDAIVIRNSDVKQTFVLFSWINQFPAAEKKSEKKTNSKFHEQIN